MTIHPLWYLLYAIAFGVLAAYAWEQRRRRAKAESEMKYVRAVGRMLMVNYPPTASKLLDIVVTSTPAYATPREVIAEMTKELDRREERR